MPGSRVVSSRPDPAAGGGEFTKAFASVLDAIQAGRQAAALEEQIRSQERGRMADNVSKVMENLYNKRASEVGTSQAGVEFADVYGNYLTQQGGRGDLLSDSLKKSFESGEENPQIQASRLGRVLFGSNPEQLKQINMSLIEGAATTPQTGSPAPPPTEDISETGEPPTPFDASTLVVGPSTPNKVEQTMGAFEKAMKAVDTQGDDPKALLSTLTDLKAMNAQRTAGATKENRQETVLANTFGKARVELWKAAFGETWADDAVNYMLGTRKEQMELKGRSGGGMDDRTYSTLLIALLSNKSAEKIAEGRDLVDERARLSQDQRSAADREASTEKARKADLTDRAQTLEGKLATLKADPKLVGDEQALYRDPRWKLYMGQYAEVLHALTGVPPAVITEEIRTETGRSKFYNFLKQVAPTIGEAKPGSFWAPANVETVPTEIVPRTSGGLKRTTEEPATKEVTPQTRPAPQQVPTTETLEQRAARIRREARER